MKKLVALLLSLALLTLSACGTDENSAHAPFSHSDCNGKSYEEVMSALSEAGFTNVQTETLDTKSASIAGTVKAVTFDGKSSYSTGNSFKKDCVVEVSYYALEQIEVFMNISVGGEDGKPEFTVDTNLPDGAILTLTLVDDNYFSEQQEVKVKSGSAIGGAFTNNGRPLAGEYTLTVVMLPGDQSFFVKTGIGTHGECLSGPLVETDSTDGSQYIFTEYYYTSPVAALTEEEIKTSALNVDSAIMSIVSAAEQEYKAFTDGLSAGTMSNLEIYNSAQALKGSMEHHILYDFDNIETDIIDGADDLVDAASKYIYSMTLVADKTLSYLDDPKTSKLSELQSSMETVSSYMLSFASCRLDFLTSAGFTNDEIVNMSTSSVS